MAKTLCKGEAIQDDWAADKGFSKTISSITALTLSVLCRT